MPRDCQGLMLEIVQRRITWGEAGSPEPWPFEATPRPEYEYGLYKVTDPAACASQAV